MTNGRAGETIARKSQYDQLQPDVSLDRIDRHYVRLNAKQDRELGQQRRHQACICAKRGEDTLPLRG